jgi:phosphate transport system substrate-binding protein
MARSWQGGLCLFALAIATCCTGAATIAGEGDSQISGAGSSLAAPVIDAWSAAFVQEKHIAVRYRSVGSGDGIGRLLDRSVDFALVDVPLTQADLQRNDLIQYPVVLAAVVPVANVPGIGKDELRLSGPVLAQIFLGRISAWNAPELRSLNPGLDLPSLPIKVIHRSDTSGTTFVFTYYLSKVSPDWGREIGIGSRLNWPSGDAARGNEGVAQEVGRTIGGISYLELGHAIEAGLRPIRLTNGAGRFVDPTEKSIMAAVSGTAFSRHSYYEITVNAGGETTWPIVAVSYVVMPRKPSNFTRLRQTLEFLRWIYGHGSQIARSHHYVPISDRDLINRIESSLRELRDSKGNAILGVM